MSTEDEITGRHECGGDAAAYVLGALDAAEAEAFREHLASCVVCRDEVAALREVTDELPLAATQYSPPRSLRRQVMEEVRSDARAQKGGTAIPRIRVPRPVLAGGLAAVIALAVVGVVELAGGSSGGVRVISAEVSAPAATAEVRLSSGRAELIVRHLPAPPPGKIYELWLKRGASSPPSPTRTLFSVTSTGSGDVGVPGSLSGISELLVTPEPAGGSLTPTHAPVIVAQLA